MSFDSSMFFLCINKGENMNPRFSSKVDLFLKVILVFLPLSSVWTLVALYINGDPEAWVGWIGFGFIAVIYGGLLIPLYYELEPEGVLIRFGMVRSRIPYTEIERIVPSRNLISSPALSLDRIHICGKNSFGAIISPLDKQGFLKGVAERAFHLKLDGDKLIPKEG